jgi:hypothetical protein
MQVPSSSREVGCPQDIRYTYVSLKADEPESQWLPLSLLFAYLTTLSIAQAQAGSSLANFSTLKLEAMRSSETSVHTRATRRHIPEDGILHSHRRENLKFYKIKIAPVPY